MSTGTQKRTRSQRVAALELPPGFFQRLIDYLQQSSVLLRIAILAAVAIVLWAMTDGGEPHFPFRERYVPPRNIDARVAFSRPDPERWRSEKEQARNQVPYVYENNPEPLINLRAALQTTLADVQAAATLADLKPGLWQEFELSSAKLTPEDREKQFQAFRAQVNGEGRLQAIEEGVARAFADFEKHGLLKELAQRRDLVGNQREISVITPGIEEPIRVPVSSVHISGLDEPLRYKLLVELRNVDLVNGIYNWLRPKLPTTLTFQSDKTQRAMDDAEAAVPEHRITYQIGESLAEQGKPLTPESISLLKQEHDEWVGRLTFRQRFYRSMATLGLFVAMYTLCGFYIFYREPRLLSDLRQFSILLGLVVITVGLCLVAAQEDWRAEIIPLLLFGMTVAIAYHQELALLLSAALSLIVAIALGHGLPAFVTMLSAVAVAVLLLGRIRSRRKLIYVGLFAGLVAGLTAVGVNTLDGQPLDAPMLRDALQIALWAMLSGFLMTGLLPFVENLFGVLTDISLLELGDVAHPLLQELVRRAPGTYNHSINVASIAEAAAESIGARGLLARVGAYFHDIGKMLKPGYFVENQGTEGNRHESLVPTMSTLIIIAHIKDGADLARAHHLPQPIIDFIQQHHGTTLVEYFYRRASEQHQADPIGTTQVDESTFRYPGPKPQTKETGVLMLADAVESASRVLVEPTPARIESLVHDIVMKRLLDRQFDECGLTLQELRAIEDSLVKSLTAVYHGRVKYPGQRTA